MNSGMSARVPTCPPLSPTEQERTGQERTGEPLPSQRSSTSRETKRATDRWNQLRRQLDSLFAQTLADFDAAEAIRRDVARDLRQRLADQQRTADEINAEMRQIEAGLGLAEYEGRAA